MPESTSVPPRRVPDRNTTPGLGTVPVVPSQQMTRIVRPTRRDFLRLAALTGLGTAALGVPRGSLRAASPSFRRDPLVRERHHLGPRERDVAGALPARDHGARRARSSTTTTTAGWTSSWSTAAPADFFKPKTPLRNALYKNNRDGTFTDVTEKAGVAGGKHFGMGVRRRRLRQRRLPGPPRHRLRHAARSTTTTATARSPTSPRRPALDGPGLDHQRRLVRLRQRRQARSVPLQLRRVLAARATSSAATTSSGKRFYCIPRVFKPTPSAAVPQQRRRHVHAKSSSGTDIEKRPRQGARRRRHRHQQRRADGSVRRQRHRAELPVREPRRSGKWEEIGLAAEVGFSANGTPRSGMGVDAADFDRTAGRISSSPTSTRRCSRSTRTTATSSSRDVAARQRRRAGHAPAERLGAEVLRLRQRRPRSTCSSPTATPTT